MEHYHPLVRQMELGIWAFCQGFAQNPSRGRRFVIYGQNGNGKTRASKAVRRWVEDRAIDMPLSVHNDNVALATCIFCNWPRRVDRMKAGDWDLEDAIESDLLILDDIGAEHDPSRVAVQKLYIILEERERKWTLLTTNFAPDQWENRFERRIADRLLRNCEHLDLSELPSYSAQ